MKYGELDARQKTMVKQALLCSTREEAVTLWELANADALVSDEQAEEMYGDVNFVPEDFS